MDEISAHQLVLVVQGLARRGHDSETGGSTGRLWQRAEERALVLVQDLNFHMLYLIVCAVDQCDRTLAPKLRRTLYNQLENVWTTADSFQPLSKLIWILSKASFERAESETILRVLFQAVDKWEAEMNSSRVRSISSYLLALHFGPYLPKKSSGIPQIVRKDSVVSLEVLEWLRQLVFSLPDGLEGTAIPVMLHNYIMLATHICQAEGRNLSQQDRDFVMTLVSQLMKVCFSSALL